MLIDKFLKFEIMNNLFSFEINGVSYWHMIRKQIFDDILRQKMSIGEAHTTIKNQSIFRIIKLKIKQIPYLLIKNPLLFLKKKDILVFNHHRRVKQGDIYECIYTDPLIKEIDYSYYIFEEPILEKHFTPIPKTNIRYTDVINNIYLFRIVINSMFRKKVISTCDQQKVKNLVKKINLEFEINLNSNLWINKINNKIVFYKVAYKYYSKIIDKVKPRVIIQVVSYLNSRFVINDIAKRKGIPTVELQHGTMGKYHIAYNFLQKVSLTSLPDYVFLFGQYWKESTRLPLDDSKIKIVGWPYYETKVRECKSMRKKTEKKVILFISQGIIGKELSRLAIDLLNRIDLNCYKIIYKLHPGEYDRWINEYPWLDTRDIEVIDNNQYDMHHYFAKSDIQVGVSSTALFEGIGYGLKTYIYKIHSYEYMEGLYKNNSYILIDNIDDLLIKLKTNDSKELKCDISYFWEKNSINNIIREINLIIDDTNVNWKVK